MSFLKPFCLIQIDNDSFYIPTKAPNNKKHLSPELITEVLDFPQNCVTDFLECHMTPRRHCSTSRNRYCSTIFDTKNLLPQDCDHI